MNSFTLHAVGTLTRNPELLIRDRMPVISFNLQGEDDGQTETWDEVNAGTTVWFRAFGEMAYDIHKNAREGDQLIVEARVSAVIKVGKSGERYCDTLFTVTGFRYGARKGGGTPTPSAAIRRPPNPTDGATEERAIAVF